jgi:hypothetical protein
MAMAVSGAVQHPHLHRHHAVRRIAGGLWCISCELIKLTKA